MGLYIFSYFCLAVFILAAVLRIYKQLRLPFHLRWELYPVRHERGKRAEYGGSYMEETDWWDKKRERSLVNELTYMGPEIFFLRGLWSENRRLWNASFPFHLGLYLLVATFILLVFGAGAMVFGRQIVPGTGVTSSFLYYIPIVTGVLGLLSGLAGSAALLTRRLRDPELKIYSTLTDYLNLVFFLIFFCAAFLAWLFHDQSLHHARAYLYGLLTFGGRPGSLVPDPSLLGASAAVFASLIAAYIPLTHMSHMFMKYFMYHRVRWDDAPNIKGGKMEAAILGNLGLKPTWSARHIGADGRKTWADVASTGPKEGK